MGQKVLIENERVKVMEVTIPPGGKLPKHTHPAYVAYPMNPAKAKITFPDGSARIVELVKGKAVYSEGDYSRGGKRRFNRTLQLGN